MKQSNLHIFLIITFIPFIISLSCRPEEKHPVPDIYVNFNINLQTDPEYYILRTQGTSVVVTSSAFGGLNIGYDNNGIIVYNAGGEYYAFDRTCPFDFPESVTIEVDGTGSTGTCPRCSSIYVFPAMGLPADGSVSDWPLKTYNAFYNPNTGDLFISN